MPNDPHTPPLRQAVEDLVLIRERLAASLPLLAGAIAACLASQEAAAQAKQVRASKPPRPRKGRRQGA